ncbi:histone acetylation protein-domain-containing protein [Pisolithus marmoratus]|nr:histone acetylation protein-domain-containing protein [Pisolithus marmoratus]
MPLLASLANLPGSREFHLHVLVSSPRKHSNLYPFASQPRPRTYLQDILILLSEQASPDARRLFVSAIEASVYHIPSTSSAIVYVSKVDSTGQATAPSPTSTLVRAFLSYYANPSTRPLSVDHLWVHLFARAQNQLCAWWKRQFTSVAEELLNAETLSTRLYYMLPGLGELEASHLLGHTSCTSASSVTWVYGHPYSQIDVPLPGVTAPHIGQIIPWFDDDPKARFIDEIAYTTEADGVKSPERKRPRIASGLRVVEEEAQDKVVDKKDAHSQKEEQATKALRKVSVSEFWERMSFRQECIAGAITGFFVMAVSSGSPQAMARSEATPLAPQPGQVAPQLIKRVLTSLMTGHEFPTAERAAWSTKVLEESIRGLCDGLRTVSVANVGVHVAGSDRSTPEPSLTCATPQTPPPRLVRLKHSVADASPNPFPEPVTSLETYNAFVYGSLAVNNPGLPRKTPAESGDDGKPKVTVLTVRRKKRVKP